MTTILKVIQALGSSGVANLSFCILENIIRIVIFIVGIIEQKIIIFNKFCVLLISEVRALAILGSACRR